MIAIYRMAANSSQGPSVRIAFAVDRICDLPTWLSQTCRLQGNVENLVVPDLLAVAPAP
jgi:hypothetical protein